MATLFQPNKQNNNANANAPGHKFSDMKEAMPRISLEEAEDYRGEQDITIVAKPLSVDNENEVIFECVLSGKTTKVRVPTPDFLTVTVEVTLRYRTSYSGDSSEIEYDMISGAQLNDDFDVEGYKSFMKVVKKYRGLFY